MRIICDHCDRPISGTVKRMPENLNFHADCLAQLANERNEDATAALGQSQEGSISELGDSRMNREERIALEHDAWNVFKDLGSNFKAYLIRVSNLDNVQVIPPLGANLEAYYVEPQVVDELTRVGLVEKVEDALVYLAVARYQLTERGRNLYAELSRAMVQVGDRLFSERIRFKST